jgi:hypothetical protein
MQARDPGVCQTCGLPVDQQFRQVHGDNNDIVHRCYNCDTADRVHNGSAAGRTVAEVDPLEEPWRFYERRRDIPEAVHALIAERQQVAADGGEVADD